MILAAGFGKRLNPLTLNLPKPLLKIGNETLLSNTINFLDKYGIKEAVINVHYFSEQIIEYVNKKKFNLKINIVNEKEKILDTGGGIFNALKYFKESFVCINPDTIWNLNYLTLINQMKNFYFSKNKETILLVVEKNLSFDKNLKGDFTLSENLLKKKKENNYIYTGCQIINRKVFSSSINKNFSILQIWNSLIKDKKLHGFRSDNEFLHVTNLEVYNNLLKGN